MVLITLDPHPKISLTEAKETLARSVNEPPDPFWGLSTQEPLEAFAPDGFGDGAVAHRLAGLVGGGIPYLGILVIWQEGVVQAMLWTFSGPPPASGEPPAPDGMLLAERQRDKLRAVLAE
ncbi:MAG: hypothetical protein HYX51_07425 [Chloroflexi bacterium]|nr:hypothetical protein [Chloroflexota bacterium]